MAFSIQPTVEFRTEYQGHTITGTVDRASVPQRANERAEVLQLQEEAPEKVDAYIYDVVANSLDSIDVDMAAIPGVPDHLPAKGAESRAEWVGWLPGDIVGAIIRARHGAKEISEDEGNG